LEPTHRHHRLNARDLFDDGELTDGEGITEGDFVANRQALCGAAVADRDGEFPEEDEQDDEQEEADRGAKDAEQQPAFVPERIAHDEASDAHVVRRPFSKWIDREP
jgi:hypothetical protein